MMENFEVKNGWLIPFKEEYEYIFKMYTDYRKKEDSSDFNYLREHNDGC